MGKVLNNLINCRGEKSTPLNLVKDFYFFFMLLGPITGISMLLSENPGDYVVGSYVTFMYFGVLAFYWTPIFQDKLDIKSRSLNILMYLFQWIPYFGNLGLVALKLSKRGKSSSSSGKIRKVELKRKKKSHKTDSNDSKSSSAEKSEDRKNKDKIRNGERPEQGEQNTSDTLEASENEISDDKSATRGKEKESTQEKKELLERLEIKLKNKGYSEKSLEDVFEKLDISEIEKAKIKTALHFTANNTGLSRILSKLNIEKHCEKDLGALCKELEEEKSFSKSKEPISFELESYNKSSNEECLNLIKKYHKRGRTEARLLEKIGRRLTITGEDNACEVLEILNKSYTEIKNRKEKFNRDELRDELEKLRAVAENAKDSDLDVIGRQLEKNPEIDLLEPNSDKSVKNNSDEVEDRDNKENQEDLGKEEDLEQKITNDNYKKKINSFREQGGYKYQLLERIGRRILKKDGARPREIHEFMLEISENNLDDLSKENLEKLGTAAKDKNLEKLRKQKQDLI